MPKFIKRVSKKIGLSPGPLVHIGNKKIERVGPTTMIMTRSDLKRGSSKPLRNLSLYGKIDCDGCTRTAFLILRSSATSEKTRMRILCL